MYDKGKSLLVRADFVLGKRQGGDKLTYRRWRRILIDALPGLMGCADRCPRAERVRLRKGNGEGRFSGWLRIPVERRPGRKRYRKFKAKLRKRLESNLTPIDGEVVKVSVRRCRPLPRVELAVVSPPESVSVLRLGEQRELDFQGPALYEAPVAVCEDQL